MLVQSAEGCWQSQPAMVVGEKVQDVGTVSRGLLAVTASSGGREGAGCWYSQQRAAGSHRQQWWERRSRMLVQSAEGCWQSQASVVVGEKVQDVGTVSRGLLAVTASNGGGREGVVTRVWVLGLELWCNV